jgi:hypothetical protein
MEEKKALYIYPVLWSLVALLGRPEQLALTKSVGK